MLGIHCGLCVGFRASLAESLTNVYTCVLEAHTCYAVSLEMPLPLFQLNIFYVPYHVLYVQPMCVYVPCHVMPCHAMQNVHGNQSKSNCNVFNTARRWIK